MARMHLPKHWPMELSTQIETAFEKGSRVLANKAMCSIKELPQAEQGTAFTLGLCGTFTLEPLSDFISLALATTPVQPKLVFADLDNIEQSLLDPHSQIHAAIPSAIVVFLRMEELIPELIERPWVKSSSEREETVLAVIDRLQSLVNAYTNQFTTPLFLSTFPSPSIPGRHFVDAHSDNGVASIRYKLNLTIHQLVSNSKTCHLFDFSAWAERIGNSAWDPRMNAFARQPISARVISDFAQFLSRTLAPLNRPSRKVLALDLDNTLWGGVLGEDGISGLKLSHDFPGNVYRRIQLAALALKDQGVLLVLLSKNNHQDVVQAFDALPEMLLKLDDFVATRINWEPKSLNLKEIAQELSLGLDSFTFVDDMAFEREEITSILPDVAVLNTSGAPLEILASLLDCPFFDAYRVTEEDAIRNKDYANKKQRDDLKKSTRSIEDYLRSLNLHVEIKKLGTEGTNRAVQMLAKTNQFNVTSHRHSEAAVQRMLNDDNYLILTLSLRDRFGDQGIVGLVITRSNADRVAVVDSFLLSCRALGRGAENALWGTLISQLSAQNIHTLQATYVPNGKNAQCSDLFEKFGMTLVSKELSEDKDRDSDAVIRNYTLALPCTPVIPDWLSVTEF
jgi:FkbH-like protein